MERLVLAACATGAALLLLQRRTLSALAAAGFALAAWRLARPKPQARHGRYPKQYVARRGTPEPIDGDLDKAVWRSVEWSEAFVEIRGSDAPTGTQPMGWEETKVKMLWDEDYLYIAAVMDVDAGSELVAKCKERNAPIFHTDSDFEVFIDPAGCCHGYKELEMNALNTVWNLMLNRPYSDGGGEHSGRVAKPGEAEYWDVKKQKTAARVTKGMINNPTSKAQWCVEIALAHTESMMHAPVCASPQKGHAWRINFSRVEKQGKVNWVWSPQVVWDPSQKRYAGQVNMHLPDAWGYVVFAEASGDEDFVDPNFSARHAAACVYYAAKAFHEAQGRYPSWNELKGELLGAELCDATVDLQSKKDSYTALVTAAGRKVQINHLRLMTIV